MIGPKKPPKHKTQELPPIVIERLRPLDLGLGFMVGVIVGALLAFAVTVLK